MVFKSKTVYKDLNPMWDETFIIAIEDPFEPVHVKVSFCSKFLFLIFYKILGQNHLIFLDSLFLYQLKITCNLIQLHK